MKKLLVTITSIGLVIGLAACGSTATPIPQGPASATDSATAAPDPAAVVTTCDNVREAFLTGTPASIAKALKALKRDRSADATAREYADYYLVRDVASKDLRGMDKSLIQASCS